MCQGRRLSARSKGRQVRSQHCEEPVQPPSEPWEDSNADGGITQGIVDWTPPGFPTHAAAMWTRRIASPLHAVLLLRLSARLGAFDSA